MKRLLPILLTLVACGGGGGAPTAEVAAPAATPRADLLFGYYGGCDSCAIEVADHANLYMTRPWGPPGGSWLPEVTSEIQQAIGNGQKVMLGLPGLYDPGGFDATAHGLRRLKEAGLLAPVVALYPFDEPDVHGKTDDEVRAMNAALSEVMDELGVSIPLAVIYGCDTGARPGIDSYLWIGCDAYHRGCDGYLKSPIRQDQRRMEVPGGADPWRQDPACFASRAHANPQVVAIVAFLFVDFDLGKGVRTNGMRKRYCETGRLIKGADPARC